MAIIIQRRHTVTFRPPEFAITFLRPFTPHPATLSILITLLQRLLFLSSQRAFFISFIYLSQIGELLGHLCCVARQLLACCVILSGFCSEFIFLLPNFGDYLFPAGLPPRSYFRCGEFWSSKMKFPSLCMHWTT